MIHYIQQAIPAIPYILVGISVFHGLRAKDKQDKITYMMWTIIFLLAAIVDAVVR